MIAFNLYWVLHFYERQDMEGKKQKKRKRTEWQSRERGGRNRYEVTVTWNLFQKIKHRRVNPNIKQNLFAELDHFLFSLIRTILIFKISRILVKENRSLSTCDQFNQFESNSFMIMAFETFRILFTFILLEI